jgi:hypothetical protein
MTLSCSSLLGADWREAGKLLGRKIETHYINGRMWGGAGEFHSHCNAICEELSRESTSASLGQGARLT